MDAGQVALAAVIASVIGPLLLAGLTDRNRRNERLEDYARQDAVAKQAAIAAELLTKRQDEAARRQEEVAQQAEHAATLLASRQDSAEARQEEVARRAAEVALVLIAANERVRAESQRAFGETQAQLVQIHTLVNSELTEAQRRERDATRAMLQTMKEVVTLKQRSGIDPSPETVAAMKEIEDRIDLLTISLDHKDRQTALAEKQKLEQDAATAVQAARDAADGAS